MAEKDTFILRNELYGPTESLSLEQKGMLFDAMFQYNMGQDVSIDDPITKMAFAFFKASFDRNNEKYQSVIDARKESGRKGGIAKQANATFATNEVAKHIEPSEPSESSCIVPVPVPEEKKEENTNVFLSPAEADDAQEPTESELEQSAKNGVSPCPHRKIIEIYHEVLPELPRVRVWNGKGEKSLSARWKEKLLDLKTQGLPYDEAAGLEWWRKFFLLRVRPSPLLMGKVTRQNGGAWIASLRWLVLPDNFAKTFEGNYLERRPA